MTIASITYERAGDDLSAGARSYLYQTLATAFSYPTGELCESVRSGEWSRMVSEVGSHLPFELPVAMEASVEAVDPAILQQGYVSIFDVGTGRPYCPLYEGSHRRGRMKLMEDLVRFYEYFGLKIQPGDHPDHLSTELEFMHYMTFKEAAAQIHSDSVTDVRRAQSDFLDRHLCRWLPRLHERLLTAPDLPEFYLLAGGLAEEFCRSDHVWLKAG